MTSRDPLVDRVQQRLTAVTESEAGREFLERNALQQRVVLDVAGDTNVTLRVEPHSSSLAVEEGPADPAAEYELFRTTVISLDAPVLHALLDGDLLSEHYLAGELGLHGIPPMWSVLGPLFRINAELLARDGDGN